MSNDADLESMWSEATQGIASIDPDTENWKIQPLPLARVKKIMKSEEIILQELEKERLRRERAEGVASENQERTNVKFMISGEAPVLMSKACELLIKDLSFRAWQHTERNRRRTLQRQDLHAAVGESEVYDFLIDIVPRVQPTQNQPAAPPTTTSTATVNHADMSSMMQAATMPAAFQVPQMAATVNQAVMQHPSQALTVASVAGVPVGAPIQVGVPAPHPPPPQAASAAGAPVAGTIDTSTSNPQSGMLQYPQTIQTDALHHLWDPNNQITYQIQAPDGTDAHSTTPNPVPGSQPQQQQHQQQHLHQQMQQQHQQVQQQQQQPQQQQHLQLQQPQQQNHLQLQQPVQHAQQQVSQEQQQPDQQQHQEQQQQLQQPIQVQQPQWVDPTNVGGMGTAPSAQQTPGA